MISRYASYASPHYLLKMRIMLEAAGILYEDKRVKSNLDHIQLSRLVKITASCI